MAIFGAFQLVVTPAALLVFPVSFSERLVCWQRTRRPGLGVVSAGMRRSEFRLALIPKACSSATASRTTGCRSRFTADSYTSKYEFPVLATHLSAGLHVRHRSRLYAHAGVEFQPTSNLACHWARAYTNISERSTATSTPPHLPGVAPCTLAADAAASEWPSWSIEHRRRTVRTALWEAPVEGQRPRVKSGGWRTIGPPC